VRISRRLGLAAVSAIMAFGCRTPTQITIELTTTVPCGTGTQSGALDGTTIRIGRIGPGLESHSPVTRTERCDVGSGRIGSLVVVPSGSKSDEIAMQVVAGVGKTPEQCLLDGFIGGCIVARRALRFVPHESLSLPIALVNECVDVPCTATTTCIKGQCVDASIDVDRCAGGVCGDDLLGPSSGVDAGPPDGGAPDAPRDADAGGGVGSWVTMTPSSTIGFAGRALHTAIWTTKEMLVFGGIGPSGILGDGASYDPTADAWTMLPPAGLAERHLQAAVWTGTEMIVWGGLGASNVELADGARYDPVARKWAMLPATTLAGRDSMAAVWATTTRELIVWGGNGTTDFLADGAAFDPTTNTWRPIPNGPLVARAGVGVVWNGKEMIVFGGGGSCALPSCDDGAAFDPKTNAWTMLPPAGLKERLAPVSVAVGDGSLAAFFGGGQPAVGIARDDGAIYDGTLKTWSAIPAPPPTALMASARTGGVGFWAAGRLHVWGGITGPGERRADGAAYDPTSRTWSAMAKCELSPRTDATVVWTGTEAIVYGGDVTGADGDDGARFRP
jgi:N-acetylneuraminic acid mutarotase